MPENVCQIFYKVLAKSANAHVCETLPLVEKRMKLKKRKISLKDTYDSVLEYK